MTPLQQNAVPTTLDPPAQRIEGASTRAERTVALFVWGVWGAMVLVLLAAVALYGRAIPFAEDWFLVAPLTGNEPSLIEWAWTRNSEHLVPVPKALLLMLVTLAGGDFRVGMVVNAALLALAAAGALLVLRRMRGGETRLADAFVPLALLHLGHWDNVLWSWQLHIVLSTVLTCALLLMVAAWREGPPGPVAAAAAVAALLVLPLSGGNGTLVTPAFALWMLYCGVRTLRRERAPSDQAAAGRSTGVILVVGAALSLLLVAAYLAGYRTSDEYPTSPGLLVTASVAAKFVAFGLGPAARSAWLPAAVVALGALLAGAAVLAARARSGPAVERPRLVGLILATGALVGVALAMGWGRAGKVEASGYMSTRYALLAVPLLLAAYLVFELYAARGLRRLGQGVLFGAVLVLLPLNTLVGLQRRNWFDRGFTGFEADVRVGESLETLAERHSPFLTPWSRDLLHSRLEMLEQACLGPFAPSQKLSGVGAPQCVADDAAAR